MVYNAVVYREADSSLHCSCRCYLQNISNSKMSDERIIDNILCSSAGHGNFRGDRLQLFQKATNTMILLISNHPSERLS